MKPFFFLCIWILLHPFIVHGLSKTQTQYNVWTCLYLHGSGQPSFQDTSSTFEDYWGKVQRFNIRCHQHVFLHYDTVHYAFDDLRLTKQFCQDFMKISQASAKILLWTHSMGNLIVASALQDRLCTLLNTNWYAISPPTLGSIESSTLNNLCKQFHDHWLEKPLYYFMTRLNYCSNDTEHPVANPAYLSMSPSNPRFHQKEFFQSFAQVKGAMCGYYSLGFSYLYSLESLGLGMLGELAFHSTVNNDGMVPLLDCMQVYPHGYWRNTSQSLFYLCEDNHLETTCAEGDRQGDMYDHQHPCSWYSFQSMNL